MIVLYSEFGRTIRENGWSGDGSVGSDHGHGSNTMVIGGPVTAGAVGDPPTAEELGDNGYNAIKPKIDYRDVFSEAIRWIGVDPKVVFDDPGYSVTRLGLI
jgi:uncharacterized protein (DUF1501 family)